MALVVPVRVLEGSVELVDDDECIDRSDRLAGLDRLRRDEASARVDDRIISGKELAGLVQDGIDDRECGPLNLLLLVFVDDGLKGVPEREHTMKSVLQIHALNLLRLGLRSLVQMSPGDASSQNQRH